MGFENVCTHPQISKNAVALLNQNGVYPELTSDSGQLETLKQALADSDPRRRRWASQELYTREDDQTRTFLHRVMDNPRHPGRAEAMSILAALGQSK